MASKASSLQNRIPTLAEFEADVARRRAALGNPEIPCNSGERRAPSKTTLLKAIEEADAKC